MKRIDNPSPWYREAYVWLLVIFPSAAVLGGFVALGLAIGTNDGLVADDYYKQGLAINRVLKRDQIAENKHLAATIDYNPAKHTLRLQLTATSNFIFPTLIEALLLYRTRSGLDQRTQLLPLAEGVYEGSAPDLTAGRWYVQLQADDWRLVAPLNVSGSR